MGYKGVEKRLVSIYDLVQECGLFFSGEENGGYGCKSKSQDKGYPGCCYAFDCPLAYEADKEDLKKYGKGFDYYEEGEWVVQYRECSGKESGKCT